MNIDEANKIIAEYMGLKIIMEVAKGYARFRKFGHNDDMTKRLYSTSLDALIPVWGKLGNKVDRDITLRYSASGDWQCDYEGVYTAANTIQEAAAIATAKAIKELQI